MKTYVGSKIIQAEPMSEMDFVHSQHRIWGMVTKSKEGYRVVYPDGYVSWSPKETFEIAYREVTEEEKGLLK